MATSPASCESWLHGVRGFFFDAFRRYGFIKDEKYADAIKVLIPQLAIDQRSRAALSLLGYCHYMLSEFAQACEMCAPPSHFVFCVREFLSQV